MIQIKPHMRKSESYCQDQGLQLPDNLSRQQVFAESEGSDLHPSLIATFSQYPSKTDDEGDQSTFRPQQALSESKESESHCSRIANHGHFDSFNILSSINSIESDESDAADGEFTLKLEQVLTESEELESHCLLISNFSNSDSFNIHSIVNPTRDESDASDEQSILRLQQALTDPKNQSRIVR